MYFDKLSLLVLLLYYVSVCVTFSAYVQSIKFCLNQYYTGPDRLGSKIASVGEKVHTCLHSSSTDACVVVAMTANEISACASNDIVHSVT